MLSIGNSRESDVNVNLNAIASCIDSTFKNSRLHLNLFCISFLQLIYSLFLIPSFKYYFEVRLSLATKGMLGGIETLNPNVYYFMEKKKSMGIFRIIRKKCSNKFIYLSQHFRCEIKIHYMHTHFLRYSVQHEPTAEQILC